MVFNDRLEFRGFDNGEEYRRLYGEVDIASRGKVIAFGRRRDGFLFGTGLILAIVLWPVMVRLAFWLSFASRRGVLPAAPGAALATAAGTIGRTIRLCGARS